MKSSLGVLVVAIATASAWSAAAEAVKCSSDEQCGEGHFCAKADYSDHDAEGACLATESPVAEALMVSRDATAAGAPVRAARGGIVTGAIVDVVGLALYLAGGGVVGLNLGVGLSLGYAGGAMITVGSLISTASFQVRHNAYREAGFDIDTGYKAGAWVLTALTIGCFGGAMGTGLASDGSFGLAIASISLNGLAAILEVVNLMAVRSKWDMALMKGAAAKRTARFYPVLQSADEPATGRRDWIFGLGATF